MINKNELYFSKEPLPKKTSIVNNKENKKQILKEESEKLDSNTFINEEFSDNKVENKSLRDSTARKREELLKRQKERDEKRQKLKQKSLQTIEEQTAELRRLTQEELLAEAKITEKINQASLLAYQKLEIEKKKKVVTKSVYKGPIIRYHSLSMPVVHQSDNENDQVQILDEKQARTFITFTDEQTLREIFPNNNFRPKPVNPKLKVCAITGLPAKYFDPLTQTPYANLYAFKALREMYKKQQQLIKSKQ